LEEKPRIRYELGSDQICRIYIKPAKKRRGGRQHWVLECSRSKRSKKRRLRKNIQCGAEPGKCNVNRAK
jgi:hypothetical protein